MTELSPAAQEVLDAAVLPCTIRQGIAAAIEKLADQVVPNEPDEAMHFTNEAIRLNRMSIRTKILAIAAELRGTDTPQMNTLMEWQPIETAPKDKIILLYRPGHCVPWQSVAPGKYDDDKYAKRPRPFWVSWLLCSGKLDDRAYPPTHWMPMPNPPASEEI